MMQITKSNMRSGFIGSDVLSKINMLRKSGFSHCCLSLILLLAFTAGCAAPQQQVEKKRFLWPPLPDEPKIEWLARYRNQHDLPKTSGQRFLESLIGRTQSKEFNRPWGIASDGGEKIYVADTGGRVVLVYDINKNRVTELGEGEYEGLFGRPVDVDVDPSGNLYVSDSDKQKVFVFTAEGKPLASIGSEEVLDWPGGIGIDRKANRLYVANAHKHNVVVFELGSWKYLFTIGKRGEADGEFNYPTDVAVNSKGNIFVVDAMNARVQIFDRDGKFIKKFGQRGDGLTDFQQLKSIAINKADIVFLTDGRANRIMLFNEDGHSLMNFGSTDRTGTSLGGFNVPSGIYIDKNEKLYMVDSLNKKINVFQIINEEWLRQHPIKEGTAADAAVEENRKKTK